MFRFIPYEAVALYPLIVVQHKRYLKNTTLLNHERIHHQQQVELFILPFYILYGLNYLVNLVRFMNHNKAYQEILFEQEAYTNEQDLHYFRNSLEIELTLFRYWPVRGSWCRRIFCVRLPEAVRFRCYLLW